jgi:hypothetical protein
VETAGLTLSELLGLYHVVFFRQISHAHSINILTCSDSKHYEEHAVTTDSRSIFYFTINPL